MKFHITINTLVDIPPFVYSFINHIFDLVKVVDTNMYGSEFRRIRDDILAKFNGNVMFCSCYMFFEFESEEYAELFILTYS